MAREELISSAVSFLQDPSVSSASQEKKIAFLQAKNLTKEEIDIAFARAGEAKQPTAVVTSQSSGYATQQPPVNRQYPVNQGYAYPPGGQWQAPPPELPRRDWRDWFIMATVIGGVGYGLYVVAKRYISPLIAPPTPPQLQQDKESIDEQFSRAFALLDQLSSDTTALKAAEEERTKQLDTALDEVTSVVDELKSSSRRRDEDTRRISEEVRNLKTEIPKAIEGSREGNEKRLRELSAELKSLKILLGNRLGTSVGTSTGTAPVTTPSTQPEANAAPAEPQAPPTSSSTPIPPAPTASPAPREASKSPFAALGRPASIPAWQMAAASKSKNPTVTSSSSTDKAGESSGADKDSEQASAPAS